METNHGKDNATRPLKWQRARDRIHWKENGTQHPAKGDICRLLCRNSQQPTNSHELAAASAGKGEAVWQRYMHYIIMNNKLEQGQVQVS